VQPTTGDDLRRAPEGFGSRKLRTFYSPVLLQAEDAKAGKAADSVVFNGNDAEPLKVYHCEPWTERAGYYKVQVIGDYV
jgi:hypothetical protein